MIFEWLLSLIQYWSTRCNCKSAQYYCHYWGEHDENHNIFTYNSISLCLRRCFIGGCKCDTPSALLLPRPVIIYKTAFCRPLDANLVMWWSKKISKARRASTTLKKCKSIMFSFWKQQEVTNREPAWALHHSYLRLNSSIWKLKLSH